MNSLQGGRGGCDTPRKKTRRLRRLLSHASRGVGGLPRLASPQVATLGFVAPRPPTCRLPHGSLVFLGGLAPQPPLYLALLSVITSELQKKSAINEPPQPPSIPHKPPVHDDTPQSQNTEPHDQHPQISHLQPHNINAEPEPKKSPPRTSNTVLTSHINHTQINSPAPKSDPLPAKPKSPHEQSDHCPTASHSPKPPQYRPNPPTRPIPPTRPQAPRLQEHRRETPPEPPPQAPAPSLYSVCSPEKKPP